MPCFLAKYTDFTYDVTFQCIFNKIKPAQGRTDLTVHLSIILVINQINAQILAL